MKTRPVLFGFLAMTALLFTGCDFSVPLTNQPTRPIDSRLLGNWTAVDKDDHEEMHLNVRRYDDTTYVAGVDGDIWRVTHSDFAGLALVSAQDLNSDERKFVYYSWQLSADGDHLVLKNVSTKVIPADTKDTAGVQRLLKENLTNPKLFGEDLNFTRQKARY